MRDNIRARGRVTVRILDVDAHVKEYPKSFLRRVLCLPAKKMETRRHNIVTRQGDALIADAMLVASTQTKVSSASGFMQIGTGWTGNSTKTNTRCNTPTGAMEELDAGYPALKAAWGNTGDTTLLYRATFEAGKLAANGINEVALLNGNTAGALCLAYAQIAPVANVTASDTLQIEWEITFLGQ